MRSVAISLLLTLRSSLRNRAALQPRSWHYDTSSMSSNDHARRVRLPMRTVRSGRACRESGTTGVPLSSLFARDRPRLASSRRSALWTRKSRRRKGRPACSGGCPAVDSRDGRRQSAVGSATDSRRALETRNRRQSGDGREVHVQGDEGRRLRRGVRSSTTMSTNSWRPTSSWNRRRRADCCSSWFFCARPPARRAHRRDAHPKAAWTAQQFRDAFPWDQGPGFSSRSGSRVPSGHRNRESHGH